MEGKERGGDDRPPTFWEHDSSTEANLEGRGGGERKGRSSDIGGRSNCSTHACKHIP
jgi:hypothetical protein